MIMFRWEQRLTGQDRLFHLIPVHQVHAFFWFQCEKVNSLVLFIFQYYLILFKKTKYFYENKDFDIKNGIKYDNNKEKNYFINVFNNIFAFGAFVFEDIWYIMISLQLFNYFITI